MTFWTDGARTIQQGDSWALAETLEPASVDCLVTSPPYWGLRDYGEDGQFGLEGHPAEYVAKLVDLFVRLRPALKPTATVWVNLGDSYCGYWGDNYAHKPFGNDRTADATTPPNKPSPKMDGQWLRPKQLLGVPERVMIGMQDAGYILRNKMVWAKPNPMPSSVRDRLACTWEYIYLFSVSPKYYFDLEAVREAHTALGRPPGNNSRFYYDQAPKTRSNKLRPAKEQSFSAGGKNPGDVRAWPTQPFNGATMLQDAEDQYQDEQGDWHTEHLICLPICVKHGHLSDPAKLERLGWPEWVPVGGVSRVEGCTCARCPDHFAVFPPALPEWCLRAGCPSIVCSDCGAPLPSVASALSILLAYSTSWAILSHILRNTGRNSAGTSYSLYNILNPILLSYRLTASIKTASGGLLYAMIHPSKLN